MKRPNASKYDPDPAYMLRLRTLSGLSRLEWASAMGVSPRTAHNFVTIGGFSYADQFLAEALTSGKNCR